MNAPYRKRVTTVRITGTGGQDVAKLRNMIKHRVGASYVYRTGRAEIQLANYDVEGRDDLVAVYDRRVTAAMIRQDIYGEDPADIKFAEWGERHAA